MFLRSSSIAPKVIIVKLTSLCFSKRVGSALFEKQREVSLTLDAFLSMTHFGGLKVTRL